MACAIELDCPGPFSPGTVVSGNLICLFNHNESIMGIKCFLIGEEETNYTRITTAQNYSLGSQVVFFKDELTLKEACTMQQGTYKYPFSFKLPTTNIPSSFSHDYGRVVYFLKGETYRSPGRVYIGDQIINVVVSVNLNDMVNEITMRPLTYPSDENLEGCCCIGNAIVSTETTLQKDAFLLGENVDMKVSVGCKSNTEVYNVEVALVSHLKFFSDISQREAHEIREDVCKFSDRGLDGTNKKIYSFNFRIPPQMFIPSLKRCSLIKHWFSLTSRISLGECYGVMENPVKIYLGHIAANAPTSQPSNPLAPLFSTGPVPVGQAPADVYPPVSQAPYYVADVNPGIPRVHLPDSYIAPQGLAPGPMPMPSLSLTRNGRPVPSAPLARGEEEGLLHQGGDEPTPPPTYDEAIQSGPKI